MMRRLLLTIPVIVILAPAAPAAVVVVANFTSEDVSFTVVELVQKPHSIKIAPAQVLPIAVTGPADLTFPAQPKDVTLRIDPYNAYVFVPDDKVGRRLEGIELPGNPPERDARPELNPVPRIAVKLPVTLLVDDADPRTQDGWQQAVRARFDEAAAVIEAHAGFRLEFARFDTWKSDSTLRDVNALLGDFEGKVAVKPGQLAIGYTSRRVEETDQQPAPFGACRPFPTSHVLMREWMPRANAEKVEVLTRQLGLAFGAVPCPDAGSVVRPTAGTDGVALHRDYRMRFDPLNALALNIWADELRRGPVEKASAISAENKIRLARVYRALLKAQPGDTLALTYLNEFDRADRDRPADPMAKKGPPTNASARDEVARAVVRAVTARARLNSGRDVLTGDELTAAYVRVAADAAMRIPNLDPETRAAGFVVGLGIALEDSETLRNDVVTQAIAKAIESDGEWGERLAVLGNPTLRGRRDLCRRFALGCVTGEMLSQGRAEETAIARSLSSEMMRRPAGYSFPALAAEVGGVAFARRVRDNPSLLSGFSNRFSATDWLPNTDGLRDGLSVERFEDHFGSSGDLRFQEAVTDIRLRVKKSIEASR